MVSISLNREIKEVEDEKPSKPVIPRPPNPLTNSILYRLSGIEHELESDEAASDAELPKFCSDPNEENEKEWKEQFTSSEFQPYQYFLNDENGMTEERAEGESKPKLAFDNKCEFSLSSESCGQWRKCDGHFATQYRFWKVVFGLDAIPV